MEIYNITSNTFIKNIDMNSIDNIFFINLLAHGDILYSKKFVLDIMSKLPNKKYTYILHNHLKNNLNDIDLLNVKRINDFEHFNKMLFMSHASSVNIECNIGYKEGLTPYFIQVFENNLFINTWVMSFIGLKTPVELISSYIKYFSKNLYPFLNINLEEDQFYNFSLTKKKLQIDYSMINSDYNKNILLLDGYCTSGQVDNFNLDDIGVFFKKIGHTIISSHSVNNLFTNINSIAHTDFDSGNLLELQTISTKCKIIIGRNSGLMQHTFIEENRDKIFFVFSSCTMWKPNYLNVFTIFCKNKSKEQCIQECLFLANSIVNYNIS